MSCSRTPISSIAPDVLTSLVERAQAGGLVLTLASWSSSAARALAELRLDTGLHLLSSRCSNPFAWITTGRRPPTAGPAAGGCMLVRADTLAAAGGTRTPSAMH